MKLCYFKKVLFDTEKFVFITNCLVTMESRSTFKILQIITIPMIYSLFVFIFRYLIFFNIIRKLLFF